MLASHYFSFVVEKSKGFCPSNKLINKYHIYLHYMSVIFFFEKVIIINKEYSKSNGSIAIKIQSCFMTTGKF